MAMLKVLATVLANPSKSPALQAVVAANPVRISMSQDYPGEAIRTDDRAGTRERGRLDPDGNFIPLVQQ